MPASAHHGAPGKGAQIIDFAARSARRSSSSPVASGPLHREGAVPRDPQVVRDVVAYVEAAMDAEGVSLGDPAVAAASRAWAAVMEQIVLGAWRLRTGDAERGIEADAGRGLDAAGVETMMGALRDMRLAPDDYAAIQRAAAREL